jgi:single-strand DNA-binding protein
MAGDTVVTLVGNLVDDPELRFIPSGAAVAKFKVASTARKFNRETNAWEDDKDGTLFLTCSVWRDAAEHCAESLQKGMRVIVQGRLKQRSYDDREGVKRTVYELDVEEVGPSLLRATAKVTKAAAKGQSGYGQQGQQPARQGQTQQPTQDPWSQSQGGQQGGGWGNGSAGDEPPPF